MSFTAKDVQLLRERTGCGMMDCKKALTESVGDMEKAIEILREKGLAAAAKKAGRIASEGIVYALYDEEKKIGTIIEVNSETDFVAKNSEFLEFVNLCAKTIIDQSPANVEDLLNLTPTNTNTTIAEILREKILVIGENMKIRRFERYEGEICTYIHGGGRIGVMVAFNVDGNLASTPEFKVVAKDVAMQIAAAHPTFLSKESVPSETLDKEKEILKAQAVNEGKPEAIAEKMVIGRINKYYKDVCLLEQPFVKDGDISVSEYLKKKSQEFASDISVKAFVRFEKGEGLEKKSDNFADEVANMIK